MAEVTITLANGWQTEASAFIDTNPVDLLGKSAVFSLYGSRTIAGVICEVETSMLYVPYEESHEYDEEVERFEFNGDEPDGYNGEHRYRILTLTSGRSVQVWSNGAVNMSYSMSASEVDQNHSVSSPLRTGAFR